MARSPDAIGFPFSPIALALLAGRPLPTTAAR